MTDDDTTIANEFRFIHAFMDPCVPTRLRGDSHLRDHRATIPLIEIQDWADTDERCEAESDAILPCNISMPHASCY